MNLLIWMYVIFILNKDSTSSDITFEEESRKLKLTLPEELSDEQIDLKNGLLKVTILDLLRRKLGFPVQKYSSQETDLEKQHYKTQSQKAQNLLLQPSSKQKKDDQIENLIPIANLKQLAEFGHLRYNKETEPDLDEDQIVAPKGILNILRLSKENHDETGTHWEDSYKENQAEDMKSDREIGQLDGIGKTCLGREEKCKEGTYRYTDECNLCACLASEWKCTNVKCTKNRWIKDVHTNYQMLAKGSKKMYDDLRDQATGCVPGDIIHAEGPKDCPCRCVLPSVVVCDICPALNKVDKPQKRNTTNPKPPKKGSDYYNYHYD